MKIPWRQLRHILASFSKRQRRELKMQAAMRGIDGIGLVSGSTRSGGRNLGVTDVDIEQTFAMMAASGFPVKER